MLLIAPLEQFLTRTFPSTEEQRASDDKENIKPVTDK